MRKLSLLALALSASFNIQAFELDSINSISLWGGLMSKHDLNVEEGNIYEDYQYNSKHNSVGFILNDKYFISFFENSYYNDSVLIANNVNLYYLSLLNEKVNVSFNVLGGLVLGYEKEQTEIGYIDNGISIAIMANVKTSYSINNKFSVSSYTGVIPSKYGVVYTQSFSIDYKF